MVMFASRWVMSWGRFQALAGTGGCQGFPVNRVCRTVRALWPCLRAVSM